MKITISQEGSSPIEIDIAERSQENIILQNTNDYVKLYTEAAKVISSVCKKYKMKTFVENSQYECNLTVYFINEETYVTDEIYSDILETLNRYYSNKGVVFVSDNVGSLYLPNDKEREGITFHAKMENPTKPDFKKSLNVNDILNLPEVKRLLTLNNKEIFSTKFSNTDKVIVKYYFYKSDFEESLREGNKQFTIGQLSYTCANSGDYGNFDDFDVFMPAFKSLCQKINPQKLKLELDDYSDDETVYILASLK